MCALLNYRVCLLFNRSAEEVMPQSMSQPSCIIAPVCHCQGLGKATSDCFSPSPPFSFPPCLFLSPLQSVFSLDSLTYPAEIDRVSILNVLEANGAAYKRDCVLSPNNVADEPQIEIHHSVNQEQLRQAQ